MRINKNVIIGVGGAAVVVLAVAPRAFGALLPLLVVAACPLSMVLMMRVMGGHSRDRQQPLAAQPDDAASAGQIEHLRAEIARLREEVGSSEPERDADRGRGTAEAG